MARGPRALFESVRGRGSGLTGRRRPGPPSGPGIGDPRGRLLFAAGVAARLLLGVAGAAASLLLRYLLLPVLGPEEPLLPLFPLVLAATLLGGLWAGAACLVAGLAGAWYLFMGRPNSFALAPHELGGLIGALVAGLVIVGLCAVLRRLIAQANLAAAQQRIIAREYAHRMRNTLTLVLAISRRTFTEAHTLADARSEFEARVIALSQAQAALLDAQGGGAELLDIVGRTLAPFGYTPGGGRITVKGPTVRLGPDAATALALALHELSTNATKYGALSAPGGAVSVEWRLGGRDRRELQLTWRECGGPPVVPPHRRGFGSHLIEQNLSRALAGKAKLRFDPEGVTAEITARLSDETAQAVKADAAGT